MQDEPMERPEATSVQGRHPKSIRVQIVLYDTDPHALHSCLESISVALHNAAEKSIICDPAIVIGDCSADPIIDEDGLGRYREYTSSVGIQLYEYTHFGKNLGFGGGHNKLLPGAKEDLCLILNPDTYSSPQLITEMAPVFDDQSIGIVDAKQLPLEHPKSYDPVTMDTSWALGACLMIRTSIMHEIGGFDDKSFFLYCEDVDLSWRTRLQGWRVVHWPHAKIFHDKYLDEDGVFIPAATEPEYSAESSLLLAYKYSRDDIVDKMIDTFLHSPARFHRKAVDAFQQRKHDGGLPDRLDAEHKVGQFIGFDFAEHRFSYAD